MRKEEGDNIKDPEEGEHHTWAVMADGAFIGLQNSMRVIIPNRKDHVFNLPEVLENKSVSSQRSDVEHFYQRLKTRYMVMAARYKYEKISYELVWRCCAALTNYHILQHPLKRGGTESKSQ